MDGWCYGGVAVEEEQDGSEVGSTWSGLGVVEEEEHGRGPG